MLRAGRSPDAMSSRRRASPREAWLLTDPTEQPSTSAVSASDRSSQYRRTRRRYFFFLSTRRHRDMVASRADCSTSSASSTEPARRYAVRSRCAYRASTKARNSSCATRALSSASATGEDARRTAEVECLGQPLYCAITLVYCRLPSRLSSQKVNRARWCCCTYPSMFWKSLTVTFSPAQSVLPFIDEIPCLA